MPKKFEMTFELNGDIDPRLLRTFDTLSHEVTALKTDFNSLRRTRGLDKVTADAEDATEAFHDLREQTREFKEVFDKTLQFTGAHKIITTVGDMFSNMIGEVGALDDSVHQMGAATGATAQEMAQFKDIIQEIYNGNYGEGFRDIADSLVNVKQVTGLTGDALEEATKKAIILRDTFGYDINESVRTVDALMRNMGLTADQAFNLIAQGTQRGLNRYDDFLDTINEYSVHFKDAGYNAEQMFSILESGSKSGTWNLDKMGDLLKEFNIRIRSGDDNIYDTMAALFAPEGIENFIDALKKGGAKVKEFQVLAKRVGKDTAKEMIKDLNGTAKKSQKAAEAIMETMSDSGRIFEGLANGSMQAKDALNEIIGKLDKIDDINYRNQLSVDLFGTQYEDLKGAAVDALKDVNGEYDKTLDTMQQIEGVKYSSLTKDIQKVGRELMTNVVIPIGEDLMPMLQDLSHWASDNKDLVKTLALGVPAAMLTKNAVSMSKDFAKVGKSLFDTTNGVSKFGRALTFMTNPVGIAVGALGVITTGVIAYKKHQEEARQALLNMGESLDEAYSSYSAIDEQSRKTRELIKEYDRLSDKIKDSTTPAEELAEARRKQKNVEQELIDMNPDILSAEDARTGRFREQAGYAQQIRDAQKELNKLDLEKTIFDGMTKLPELEENLGKLREAVPELEGKKDQARKDQAAYQEFNARLQSINQNRSLSLSERNEQRTALFDDVQKYRNGNDDLRNRDADLANMAKEMQDVYRSNLENLRTSNEELGKAEKSYQTLYDQAKHYIEIQSGLEGTFEEQAKQYKNMSAEQKKRFDEEIQKVIELNDNLDMLPKNMKIDLDVIYREIGKPQTVIKYPTGSPMKNYAEFADGGHVTSPTMALIGEGGDDEFVIPVNNSRRSRGLYAAAGEALGLSPGGTWAPVFTTNITIQGNADAKVVKAVVNDAQKEWENHLRAYERTQQRRSLSKW
ncbi:phage tail tape measure protein [Paenibacillus sp. USDA918EY]|uniref:phage tail tape measure protein n=1 Tax=Paenibacillus sp. USDA918EY TaxID=2689575 RepID=UPI0013580713|nr:phage tail tape measure protein [Paenibacillus sp. USDA918EY]